MKKILIIGVIVALFATATGVAYTKDIAVIVNKENTTSEVSYRELEKIFKQEKQFWENGGKIYIIMPESKSLQKEVILKKIYKMSEQELKRFWLAKIFKGEITSFPKVLSSNESIKLFVREIPDAIGLIEVEFNDDTVKALKIDGRLPAQEGYALNED